MPFPVEPEQTRGQGSPAATASRPLVVADLLREGREKAYGYKGTFWAGCILTMLVSMLSNFNDMFITGDGKSGFGLTILILVTIVTIALQTALSLGVFLLGVRRARGEGAGLSRIWEPVKRIFPLCVLYLGMYSIIALGFVLLIVPGIYFMIAYSFAPLLLVDRKMGIWQALETSRKTVGPQWWTCLRFTMASGAVSAISLICFLIPIIWTAPMLNVARGVLYRELFPRSPRAA